MRPTINTTIVLRTIILNNTTQLHTNFVLIEAMTITDVQPSLVHQAATFVLLSVAWIKSPWVQQAMKVGETYFLWKTRRRNVSVTNSDNT